MEEANASQRFPAPAALNELVQLTCISHQLTGEARDKTAMTSLRLLAVLDL